MAGLHFPITADNRGFMQAIHEITAGVSEATRQIEANGGSIDKVISMIKTGVASIGIGLGFKELTSQITSTRDEFQKLEIAFSTFLGSEEEADKLMKQMVHTAAITPFDLAGVADGAKNLLAFGVAAEDVNKTIISLGDVAAGLSQPLGDIIYLYGTTIAKPKMDTQDLMQFMGRGIPIAKELAKQFGVAENKVRDLVSAGKVSGDAVKKAFESMTGAGSMFGGLMEAQSKSIGGQIANIEDSIDEMFNAIGKSSEGIINFTLETTSKIVENWQSVLLILGDVAAAYGAQKAILALDAGFTKAATNYGYDAEIEQLKALIPAKEEEAQTALQQAVASGNLTEAKAAEILALREEAEAQLNVLIVKESAAEKEKELADALVSSLIERQEGIEKSIEDTKEYMETLAEGAECLEDLADIEEYETALEQLCTLEREKNSVANELNTATEHQNTAAKDLNAASTERETFATKLNTVETGENAAATGILTIAKEKLAVAIGKVNMMLKANQFALVTGAVIALGYAIYKVATYQSDYQKSLQKVSEATQEVEASTNKEIRTLSELKAKLDSTRKGSDEWKSTKDAIVKQFGQYIPQLDEEITKVGNLSTAYHDLTKAIQEANAAKGLKSFLDKNDNTEDVSSKWREALNEWKNSTGKLGKKGEAILEPILREYALNSSSDANLYEFIEDQLKINYGTDTGASLFQGYKYFLDKSKLEKINEAHQMNRNRELEYEMYRKDMGISKETFDKVRYGIEPPKNESEKEDKAYWEGKKKDALARLEALDSIAAAGEEGAKIKKEIDEYDKELASYSIKKQKQSGPTSAQLLAKEENAAGKLADVMRRQAQERLRMEQDYEHERWQTRIDLMEEGEAKILSQQKLDFEKERIALQRRKEQEIESELNRQMALFDAQENVKAAADKKYAKKTFRDSDIDQSTFDKIEERYKQLESDLTATQKKAEQDRLDAAKESMNAYLKEFGNYQQKRLAIEQEYEKKISEAPNRGERKIAIANKDKALADLDFEEWQENGGMALAFGDISRLSKETITQLISDMEKYRSKIIATFDPDKIQKFEDTLANLRSANIDFGFSFNDGNDILDSMRERLALQQQISDATANETALLEQKKQIEQELAVLNTQIFAGGLSTSAMDPNGEKADDATIVNEDMIAQADALRVKLDAVSRSLEKSSLNSQQLQSQLKALGKVKFSDIQKFSNNLLKAGRNAADLASIFSDDVADAIQTGADKVGVMFDAFTELSSNIEMLAKAGKDAVKATVDASKGIVEGASEGMKASAAATATSLSTMEKASAILAIIGAAIQLATMIASLFNSDKKHEKNIKKLQEQIDALQNSYDKLGRKIDEAYSTDASALIGQQETLLRQQQELIKQQYVEEFNKKKTDTDKLKEYKERIQEIEDTIADNKKKAKEAIIGEDLKSAINEFASLYAEAWNDGTDAAQKSMAAVKSIISSALSEMLKKDIQPAATRFYDALAEAMKDGVLTDAELANLDAIKREMDALAAKSQEQWEMIQSRYKDLDELKEELTDISFDSIRDNFKGLLSDMESTTVDFTNSFSDMLRNALLEGLMSEKYDLMLKEWYDEFAEAMNDKTLTDSERDALRQQYDAIVQQGLADRDFINDIVGGGAYSQEASKGGWGAMSQDTADELNGRFTALTELSAIGNTLSAEQNLLSAQILETLRSMTGLTMVSDGDNSTLREIRDMMFLSTGHLEDIAKHSKQLYDVNTNLSELRNLIDKRL